jgi:hypothetical protein
MDSRNIDVIQVLSTGDSERIGRSRGVVRRARDMKLARGAVHSPTNLVRLGRRSVGAGLLLCSGATLEGHHAHGGAGGGRPL